MSASKEGQGGGKLSIHIDDQQVFAQKDRMTGAELRNLVAPPIAADRALFLKVPGPQDDIKIADGDPVDLKSGMHFFSVTAQINPGYE